MTRLVTVLAVAFASAAAPLVALDTGAVHAASPTGALAEEIMRLGGERPSAGNRGYVAVPPEVFTSEGNVISPIIFVNRCRGGCSFTKASLSDSISNQTIIGPLPAGTWFTLSEFGYSDEVWNQT